MNAHEPRTVSDCCDARASGTVPRPHAAGNKWLTIHPPTRAVAQPAD